MLGGGEDSRLYVPLTREGNLADSEALGCHRGTYEWMNVTNAQPGYIYYLGRRTEAGLRQAALRGWQVVPPDSPERLGERTDPNFQAAGLDGVQTGGELVLMYMPESRYRVLCEEREERSARMRDMSARQFTESDRARTLQERYRKAIFLEGSHGVERY